MDQDEVDDYMPLSPALLSCKTQIIFAYEELNLSPADITSQFDDYDFEEADIRTLLADCSSRYREELQSRQENKEVGTEDELLILKAEYRHLSRTSANDLVKERALKFLINEKKGRNDLAARTLQLKERTLGASEVDTTKRASEFLKIMQGINEKLAQVAGEKASSHQVLELVNSTNT